MVDFSLEGFDMASIVSDPACPKISEFVPEGSESKNDTAPVFMQARCLFLLMRIQISILLQLFLGTILWGTMILVGRRLGFSR